MDSLGVRLSSFRLLVVADPFTGYSGSFEGFMKQYPNLTEIFKASVEKLMGENKIKGDSA